MSIVFVAPLLAQALLQQEYMGKSRYLHEGVDDVILASVEILQQAALEVGADQAAGCLPGWLTCDSGLQSLQEDAQA